MMAVGLSSAGVAACLLSLVAASLGAAAPPACDFQAECRPGETYRLAIPCDGKCSNYIQCQDGVAAEKRCGKFFWHQNEFDPATLDCVRSADCDWWRKVPTTTTAGPAPTTTTSAAPAETTAAASSTETTPAAEPSTSAASAETTAQPTSPSAPSSTVAPPAPEPEPRPEPSPAESGAARIAAVGPTLLAAALVLGL